MKKRVLAALLALVMLFGALPMSVFAEDLETVEEPSGTFEPDEPEKYTYHLYYDFNYVGTGSTKWNIEYGPTADTSYTYTVDSQTLTCREGYNFLGWADGKNATEPDYRGGDTITLTWQNPTKTIYAVWEEQPQPDITDPTDFAKTQYVPLQCKDNANHRIEKLLEGLPDDAWAVEWTPGSKEATLKLYPAKIAPLYKVGGEHKAVDESTVTVTLAYTNRWSIAGRIPAIPAIKITCAAPEIPDPTEFIGIKTVPVQCNNKADHYMQYAIDGLIEKKCAELVWSTGSKEATLKLYPEKIANRFSAIKGAHTAVTTDVVTVELTYNGGWKIDGTIPVIHVTCAAQEIPDPTDSVKDQYVTVVCDNKTAHPNIQYQLKNLPAGSVDVQWDRTAKTAKLVLKPEKIAEHYGKSYDAHTAVNSADVEVSLTYANDAWSLSAAIPDVHVTCKPTYLTLTYDANAPEGKTVTNLPKPQTESLQAGSRVVTFQLSWAIPVCEGYKFLGWTTDTSSTIATFPVEKLGTDEWVSTTGNPNYILYAVWEKNPFHVTYRLKDENGKWVNAYEEDVPVAGCENHTLWTPAEKTGYKFTGWYQKAEDIGKKAEVTKLFDKTWVLYGDFTPVEYTITYDYRDKDIADKKLYPENAETYTIEQTVTLNPITNKGMFGKTFLEWRCDLDKDGVAEKITEIPAGTTGDLTVKAYWNHPVTYTVYDEDGNEVEAYCETINVPEDSFGANLKPKTVEKDGYEFDGWYQDSKNFGNSSKRTETLSQAKNWKLYGKLKYVEKPVYVYVQPTYKGAPLTKNDAKAVAALERLGFTEGFNAGGKFVTLGKMMTAKTDVAGMADEIDNGKLALYSEIDTTKFNEHVLNSIGWYGENALTLVTNTTHKGYEADGKIDAYHLNGTMSFQSVTFDAGTNDKVENMPADGYYLVNDRITLSAPTREGYTFLGWSAAQDTPVITANPETDGETLYPADHEWTVIGDVTFTAVWELNLQTVNVVIYRNGDMTKPFKTVPLEKQPKGTVIDLTALNIANYYTANSTGKYDFYGWYNDGKWNNYKENPENPPAGLQTITVNGWTNIICMVYDYEKVIVKAITDDDKTTETQLFSGMARRGSNLLDYLAAQNIELDKVGHTHDEWYKYDSPKWKFGENDTINGWTNVLVKYARKEYTVVAKMYLDGAPHYRQNTDFYTYQVTGLYGNPIDFADIKAQAIAQAEKDRPASASYDASVIEDWAGNAACTTFGEHQPDLDTHYVNVHVNTTQHVYVYRMIDGKMEATEYHHSTAPFGANVVEHLNANVTNLDMPGYSHDEWFMKDVPSLDVKFGDTDTINGWTNVVIKYTKNEFPVTYDYACTDPALVPNWKVWETLPKNPYTYAPGESVRVAMMPDDVEDGEYIWKFVTWKLNGVDVVPNAQVPMVEGGLTFVGIWERTQKEYGVTYDYACTDPALVPNWKVWATLPENKDTYTVGQKVTTAAKPDDVEDGEYIWKFVTWKLGDTEVAPNTQVEMVAGGLTFVGIWEHTQKEYGVTYSYDPSLPDEVQATLPKNPHTYTVGQKVTTAAKPNSVRVGEYIWTFKTWKLDGVEVAPNTQVEMVSGGLHFEGIWETKLIHYSLTIQYVDKKGKELAESHMDLLSKGEAYKVDSPKIKGYKLKDKDDAVIKGTMPGRNLTIEVVYIKKSTGGGSGTIDSPNKPTTKAPALTLNTDDHFAFINGYPDGSVQPEGNVTRAETAAILYRIMGDACQSYYKTNSSSYSDVARGDWYNTYVATLENAGVIVDTRTNGKFRPNDAITRAELASMIAQFAGLESASAAKFNDVGSRYWAAEEIAIAAKMGWINGYPDGSFRPDRNVTRAELMAMVNRALGRTPKSADDLLSGMKTWRDNANVNAWYYLDVQEATNDHTYTKSGTHETWKKLL